ncbi:hypothetical protein Clacol_010395 [Clathrus columnatus]|uniref:Phosphatidate cytidylyltransferase n=1 Tax=Clathrus columnatus TaxID=1419009 RepID=A0AAV5AUX0_9AGAM|nr:hypothetical protein Clacol_010395 [Clathrus columnatus]
MAMTPANDAFTLTHSPRRSPRPTRSPSPTTMALGKLTRRNVSHTHTRRLSHGSHNSTNVLHDIGEDITKEAAEQSEFAKQQDRDEERRTRSPDVKKIDWEIPRKVLHSSIGFFVVPLYVHGVTARPVTIALSGMLAVGLVTDVVRLRNPTFEKYFERFAGFLMRDCEKHKVNGVIWYIVGVIISINCYPFDVATLSILILSWADTAASTFGRLWGRHTPPLPSRIPLVPFMPSSIQPYLSLHFARRKSLAGFLAASLTAGAIAFGFWGWIVPMREEFTSPIWTWDHKVWGGWVGLGLLSLATALIGGIAEALVLDIGSLDDNLTLPVISGGAVWGVVRAINAVLT